MESRNGLVGNWQNAAQYSSNCYNDSLFDDFNILLLISYSSIMIHKKKQEATYFLLSKKANMKFIPKDFKFITEKDFRTTSDSTLTNKLKKIIGFSSIEKSVHSDPSFSAISEINPPSVSQSGYSFQSQASSKSKPNNSSLKFIQKLSHEHLLIGNEYQLDIIKILGVTSSGFIETEVEHVLHYEKKIDMIAVDTIKNNYLVVIFDKNLYVYAYDNKKLAAQSLLKPSKTYLKHTPKHISVMKTGNIFLFYDKYVDIYLYEDSQITQQHHMKYLQEQGQQNRQLEILSVPKPLENLVTIFFKEKSGKKNICFLWCIEFEIFSAEIRQTSVRKIYQVSEHLLAKSKIKNYAKGLYLFITRNEVSVMKQGYILDSVSVDFAEQGSTLKYTESNMLIHFTNFKIEIYDFKLDIQSKPNKIITKSKDSLQIYEPLCNQYLKEILKMDDNYLFLYQTSPNKIRNGQLNYSFFVTTKIPLSDKVKILFGEDKMKYDVGSSDLLEKCDMARKMGLTNKDIYLELWKRTNQCSKQDYQILLSIHDYETIRNEVLKKLKKSSMAYKEIDNIYQECINVLEQKVVGTECSTQIVFDYISCHFFIRKLKMYKDMSLYWKDCNESSQKSDENQEKIIKLTIQNYHNLQTLDLKEQILNNVVAFCTENAQESIDKIRFLISNFKFVLRTIYLELLTEIIIKADTALLTLLQKIPELLPYRRPELNLQDNTPNEFYDGVWPPINNRQWKQSLYHDMLVNIDNREIVEEAMRDVRFRRNFLSNHDLVVQKKEQILANQELINSNAVFYHFISQILERITDTNISTEIVNFLEENYIRFPSKLKEQVFLKMRIYNHFKQKNFLPKNRSSLYEFLDFNGDELIRHCFTCERVQKGLILKKIKPIFEETCGQQKGDKLFNTALLEYFKSDHSEISDLKYILNRINHKKVEYHQKNQKMYEVLIESIQRKMLVGTDDDIPIQEVMIYIEKIPWLNKNQRGQNQGYFYLMQVQKINQQIEILQKARINMSLYQILQKPDEIIRKLVSYELTRKMGFFTQKNYNEIDEFTYEVIAKIQKICQNIYGNDHAQLTFFIYLSKLCQEISHIQVVSHLLKNQFLKGQCYTANTPSNLVQYIYQKRMSQEPVMISSSKYIKALLGLLPPENMTRRYIQAQMQIAQLLSSSLYKVQYPISNSILNISEIKFLIDQLHGEFIAALDLEKLNQNCLQIQKISSQSLELSGDNLHDKIRFIQLIDLYDLVIIKLIELKKLKQALLLLKKLMTMDNKPAHTIIYLILYIIKISIEFNDENQKYLVQLIYYYFYHPQQLFDIIESLVTHVLASKEIKQYLKEAIAIGRQKSPGFNKNNQLFASEIEIKKVTDSELLNNFFSLLINSQNHLEKSKEEFKKFNFSVIMPILCNEPYFLAHYVNTEMISPKQIRCYLSYAIQEDVFDSINLLGIGRRIFLISFISQQRCWPLVPFIEEYSAYDLKSEIEITTPMEREKCEESEMWKSSQAFLKKKRAFLRKMEARSRKSGSETPAQRSSRLKRTLSEASAYDPPSPSEYLFSNIDDDNQIDKIPQKSKMKIQYSLSNNDEFVQAEFLGDDNRIFNKKKVRNEEGMVVKIYPSQSTPNTPTRKGQRGHISKLKNQDLSKPQVFKLQIPSSFGHEDENHQHAQKIHNQQISEKPKVSSPLEPELSQPLDQKVAQQQGVVIQKQSPSTSNHIIRQFAQLVLNSNAHQIQKQSIQKLDISALKDLHDDKNGIRLVCQSIYENSVLPLLNSHKKLEIVKQILKETQPDGKEASRIEKCLDSILKVEILQKKTLPNIQFYKLLNFQDIFDRYDLNPKLLFQKIYPNLQDYIDEYNVHNTGLFVSRAFVDINLKAQVLWDFVMNIAVNFAQYPQERSMNVEKIQASLSKIKLQTWTSKFKSFKTNVVDNPEKDTLLEIFINYLKVSEPKQEAVNFLTKLVSVDASPKAVQALESLTQ